MNRVFPHSCHSRESGNPERTGCRIESGMTYLIAGAIIWQFLRVLK